MKFSFSLAALLVSVVAATDKHRRAQSGPTALEAAWNVGDPSIDYNDDTRTFTFTIAHGPGSGPDVQPRLIVQGRNEGPEDSYPDNACPTFLNDGAFTFEGAAGSVPFFDNEAVSFFEDSDDGFSTTYTYEIDGSIANFPNVFTQDAGSGGVDLVGFCIVFGLVDDSQDGNPMVTFREIGVELELVLDGDFSVESFQTLALDPEFALRDAFYNADATVCEGATQPFSQLDEVPICVCPEFSDIEDIEVTGIDSLTFSFGELSQVALVDGDPNSQTVTDVVCSDSDVGVCCRVGVLLNSIFFPDSGSQQDISVSGTAELAVGGGDGGPARRLVKAKFGLGDDERKLQDGDKVETDFALNVAVAGPGEEAESAAVTITKQLAGLVAGAAAALLL